METLLWITFAVSAVAAITNVLQLVVQWFTLREVGDLDHDRGDWFEKAPWRHYDGGGKP